MNLNFKLPISIIKESNKYIAFTPALDLSTSGDSYTEAKKRFLEIVNIFFEELIDSNNLDEVLTNLGWNKIKSKWNPPIVVSQDIENIKV